MRMQSAGVQNGGPVQDQFEKPLLSARAGTLLFGTIMVLGFSVIAFLHYSHQRRVGQARRLILAMAHASPGNDTAVLRAHLADAGILVVRSCSGETCKETFSVPAPPKDELPGSPLASGEVTVVRDRITDSTLIIPMKASRFEVLRTSCDGCAGTPKVSFEGQRVKIETAGPWSTEVARAYDFDWEYLIALRSMATPTLGQLQSAAPSLQINKR